MLCDVPTLRTLLRVSDTSQDVYLAQVLQVADRVVKQYCKQNLETGTQTEFPRILGDASVPLIQHPVRPLGVTQAGLIQGTLTAGSPTITGLPNSGYQSTASMLAGMPVCLHGQSASLPANNGAIPYFTTLASTPSPIATTATMTANATVNATAFLVFGLDVYWDAGSLAGQGVRPSQSQPGVSQTNTQRYVGRDFMLDVDEPQYQGSKSGLLRRWGSGPSFSTGLYGYGLDSGYGNRGGLTAALEAQWPRIPGSMMVTYTSGYGQGAAAPSTFGGTPGTIPSNSTLPWDLVDATARLAAAIRASTVVGAPVQSTEVTRSAYAMLAYAKEGSELGSVKKALSFYREHVV